MFEENESVRSELASLSLLDELGFLDNKCQTELPSILKLNRHFSEHIDNFALILG